MSPTVHKVLIHGPTVVAKALLPIGQLSEEVAEARNKHFRLYRLNFSRKHLRINCNTDIINRLLLTSKIIPKPRKLSKPFSKETLNMLLPSECHPTRKFVDSATITSDENSELSSEE